ncbi:Cytochrome c oxidase assembly protein COX15-like protein [Smittium mucronatum]|uniref:Cytochrome c oxidase assembly protein COX15-like protein n=1 Tax=Smittium mucronatum TaxID=133383 RepID=A0A1R0H3Y9_9FUNG|nr:Cytochrome c oxidase assembly protein COX15-like protein [Smittium mucronatum]OLY83818.1 Cytochrome c oxidase assembly protein COX15-like protein [Smittium mucronatum]
MFTVSLKGGSLISSLSSKSLLFNLKSSVLSTPYSNFSTPVTGLPHPNPNSKLSKSNPKIQIEKRVLCDFPVLNNTARRFSSRTQLVKKTGQSLPVGTFSNFGSITSTTGVLFRNLSSARIQSLPSSREVEVEYQNGKRKKVYVDSRAVGNWLIYLSSMCFGIIVWGGLTRLTESGLSIVEWAPISGVRLPTTEEGWESEFEKYKQFPEYHKVHVGISMEDFKKIYFMEWFHRNIGRLLGVMYIVPAIYFISKGSIHKKNIIKVLGLGSLIGLQGTIGWDMVSSGVNEKFNDVDEAIPRVSQYRLTTHLGAAYLLYILFSMYGFKTVRLNRILNGKIKNLDQIRQTLDRIDVQKFRKATSHVSKFALLTCLSGGMVAGLDAGLVYNEFPLMGGRILPPKSEYWSDNYATDIFGNAQSKIYNLFENPTTVQMIHRTMAITTCFAVSYLWYIGRGLGLNRANRFLVNMSFIVGLTQVGLGIGTLVNYVPVSWASAHQANSVILVATLFGLTNSLKAIPKIV